MRRLQPRYVSTAITTYNGKNNKNKQIKKNNNNNWVGKLREKSRFENLDLKN